jgi:hypothetical protein
MAKLQTVFCQKQFVEFRVLGAGSGLPRDRLGQLLKPIPRSRQGVPRMHIAVQPIRSF